MRGRQPGQTTRGSLGDRLKYAKPGDRLWTEREQRSATGTAQRAGVKVRSQCFTAVSGRQVVYLTCLEVL